MAPAPERGVFGAILGTGVGAGIVVNGQVLEGRNAIAGEWGHNPLPWPRDDERPGQRCYCGRRGCIETWVSGPAFERDHAHATGRDVPTAQIVAGCRGRRRAASVASLQRYAERLARSLAHVVNVLDPDVIVLGGGMSNQRLRRRRCWRRSADFGTASIPGCCAMCMATSGVRERRGCGNRVRLEFR